MSTIANLLGYVIRFIYSVTQDNYALTIIIFAILSKVLLFPLNLKQTKSTSEIQKIKPEYDKIVKKYADDKIKQNEEITKLYSDHNINPMGGCILFLIQFPIIISMFYIVRQPLTYVLKMDYSQIEIYTKDLLEKEEVTDKEVKGYELQIANNYDIIDMNFLGVNFGDIPSNVFSKDVNKKASPITLVVPIISVLVSMYSIKKSQANSEMTEEQMEMQKSMNMTMPMLSGLIAYTYPIALGIYWLLGNILQIISQSIINKILNASDGDNVIKEKGKKLLLNADKGGKKNG